MNSLFASRAPYKEILIFSTEYSEIIHFKKQLSGQLWKLFSQMALRLFFCDSQAWRLARHFLLATSFTQYPLGQQFSAHSHISARAETYQPTPVQTGNSPPPAASFSHTLWETRYANINTKTKAVSKETCKASTNRCSEDKAVWLSPGTLRLLISY